MSSGPSKQELEMYWQNSRQYFDELAKHYQQADPKYYKEYIAPFYNNPFRSGSSAGNKQNGGGIKFVVIMALVAFMGIAIAAVLFLVTNSPDVTPVNEKTEQSPVTDSKQLEKIEPVEEVTEKSIHFRRGEQMYNEKKYKLAEKFLKMVPETDKDYDNAQKLLKEIEKLKKTENTDGRNNRNKSIQPVR